MTPEEAVADRLLSLGAVTALVASRVYMLKLPQKPTLPAIRVQRISAVTDYHQRGEDATGVSRVQVDVYAAESSGSDPYASALDVARAVHGDGKGPSASGLSGWIGTSGGSPAIRILGMFRTDLDVRYDAEEFREVRVRQDYMVTWQ